ncbi:Lsr2 protein [Rhodococcoides kroppenstedtii]|uniref:Lsr2 protein n=2 Tax=Rhodococcoides kroppenstedtii TaxID=293050 RepID=A0A1I0T1F2_9NOCA|nr:Lsr2 protein [Rhodococcus kroppenstedtii]
MVTKLRVETLDDFTGEAADRTVVFGFGDRWFELDLTEANAAHIEGLLADWVDRAREVSTERRPASRTVESRLRSAEIRVWARNHGWDLAAHGRLPTDAVEAFDNR